MKYDSVFTGRTRLKRSQRMLDKLELDIETKRQKEHVKLNVMRRKISSVSKKMENFNNLNLGQRRNKMSVRQMREFRNEQSYLDSIQRINSKAPKNEPKVVIRPSNQQRAMSEVQNDGDGSYFQTGIYGVMRDHQNKKVPYLQ